MCSALISKGIAKFGLIASFSAPGSPTMPHTHFFIAGLPYVSFLTLRTQFACFLAGQELLNFWHSMAGLTCNTFFAPTNFGPGTTMLF